MRKRFVGTLTGKYRGIVENVLDPQMRGRVLVKVPSLMDIHEVGWAESCFMPGEFNLPRVKDFVWVEFEEGDIQKPIWVGIMPTRDYVKSYLLSMYGDRDFYDTRIHVMRSAQKGIHFRDETHGENGVWIYDAKGEVLVLNSKAETSTLISKNGTTISSNSSSYSV